MSLEVLEASSAEAVALILPSHSQTNLKPNHYKSTTLTKSTTLSAWNAFNWHVLHSYERRGYKEHVLGLNGLRSLTWKARIEDWQEGPGDEIAAAGDDECTRLRKRENQCDVMAWRTKQFGSAACWGQGKWRMWTPPHQRSNLNKVGPLENLNAANDSSI